MRKLPYFAEFMQLGWVVAISLLLPLGLGIWADRKLDTAPLFILIGMLVGGLAATVGTVRTAYRVMAALSETDGKDQEQEQKDND
jgi:F0F1-type ATP synthase assembly protein I